jgi:rubrerythrin
MDEHDANGLDAAQTQPTKRLEQRCSHCGYGIVVAGPPPRCPLCGSTDWSVSARAGTQPC